MRRRALSVYVDWGRDGNVEVSKIPGNRSPADLMTKVLTLKEVEDRLRGMNIRMSGKGVSCFAS